VDVKTKVLCEKGAAKSFTSFRHTLLIIINSLYLNSAYVRPSGTTAI
jgi:hypothetical protein